MRLYIGFLLFFVTVNNGMSLIKGVKKAIYCSAHDRAYKIKSLVTQDNQRTFSLYGYGYPVLLAELQITVLSLDNKAIGEIRIDKIEGRLVFFPYLLGQCIKLALKKNCNVIGYHDFSRDREHKIINFALLINGFTKTSIRSNLGNKKASGVPIEHYFYEKRL